MRLTRSEPGSNRHLRGSLDGPSRTITVEPVEAPMPAPPPEVHPEPAREPDRPSKPSRPPAPAR